MTEQERLAEAARQAAEKQIEAAFTEHKVTAKKVLRSHIAPGLRTEWQGDTPIVIVKNEAGQDCTVDEFVAGLARDTAFVHCFERTIIESKEDPPLSKFVYADDQKALNAILSVSYVVLSLAQ
jgi:hypothetical protein